MGAILAYLVAKKIREQGLHEPLHLFLSGCNAPSATRDEPMRYLMPKEKFIQKIKEYGGSPDEILNSEELMNFFEPILRKDFEAVETYQYKASLPLNVPITIFIGKEDQTKEDKVEKWQEETTATMNVFQFSGRHFFIFDHAKEIIHKITGMLFTASHQEPDILHKNFQKNSF
jgi:surfactin synthase thioesterase subunit